MIRLLIYQLGLNGVWCACVFGALWGQAWLGPIVAVAWLSWHLAQHAAPALEGGVVLAAGAFGIAADLVLIRIGGIGYAGLGPDAWLGPAWIVALWMVFATTVNVSLSWLRGRVAWSALLGVVGGLGSYLAGRRLGVATFDLTQLETLLALVVVWGIGVPLLLHAAEVRGALRAWGAGGGYATLERLTAARVWDRPAKILVRARPTRPERGHRRSASSR